MRAVKACFLWLLLVIVVAHGARCAARGIHHYVYVLRDRDRLHDPVFLQTGAFEGAQVMYPWRLLEPREGVYDFTAIQEDLTFLRLHGKRLFVQLQDSSFDPAIQNVPDYLLVDPRYHGGAAEEYDTDVTPAKAVGWVARRWDPAVRERFARLLAALGRQIDGRIAGINLPETAVDVPTSGHLCPSGLTPTTYRDGIVANMRALKGAFHRSVTMQYANFMPGEWLPGEDHHYLKSVYEAAARLGVGVGGPDLLPYRPGQMHHGYPLIRASHGHIPTGIAVQEGNYSAINPQTGRRPRIWELLRFAREELKVEYIFWYEEEPYFTHEVVPMLSQQFDGDRPRNLVHRGTPHQGAPRRALQEFIPGGRYVSAAVNRGRADQLNSCGAPGDRVCRLDSLRPARYNQIHQLQLGVR